MSDFINHDSDPSLSDAFGGPYAFRIDMQSVVFSSLDSLPQDFSRTIGISIRDPHLDSSISLGSSLGIIEPDDGDASKVPQPTPPADPAVFFGLQGKVAISRARLSTNGDVSLILADEHGAQLVIQKTVSILPSPPAEDAFIKVSFPGLIQGQYLLPRQGREAKALLILLRQAGLKTFGSGPFSADDKSRFERMAVDKMVAYLSK